MSFFAQKWIAAISRMASGSSIKPANSAKVSGKKRAGGVNAGFKPAGLHASCRQGFASPLKACDVSKYILVLRCKSCKHRYKRTVTVEAGCSVDDIVDPPCPKCAKKTNRTDVSETSTSPIPIDPDAMFREGRAPGIVGDKNVVKAIDLTAKIVMENYGLSDLKSNIREGETMAPRLPPRQQTMADNFFNPGGNPAVNKRQQAKMQNLGRRAIAGAFRSTALDVKSVLPDSRVALRKSGEEQIRR